jgi:hypothetical protein
MKRFYNKWYSTFGDKLVLENSAILRDRCQRLSLNLRIPNEWSIQQTLDAIEEVADAYHTVFLEFSERDKWDLVQLRMKPRRIRKQLAQHPDIQARLDAGTLTAAEFKAWVLRVYHIDPELPMDDPRNEILGDSTEEREYMTDDEGLLQRIGTVRREDQDEEWCTTSEDEDEDENENKNENGDEAEADEGQGYNGGAADDAHDADTASVTLPLEPAGYEATTYGYQANGHDATANDGTPTELPAVEANVHEISGRTTFVEAVAAMTASQHQSTPIHGPVLAESVVAPPTKAMSAPGSTFAVSWRPTPCCQQVTRHAKNPPRPSRARNGVSHYGYGGSAS